MNKFTISIVILLFPLLLLVLGQKGSCRTNKMENLSTKNDLETITGEWGGDHIGLQINEDGAVIDFDCANGKINQSIVLDREGKFNLKGTYTVERSGPIRDDRPLPTHPANYSGVIQGKAMTLTVTFDDTKEDIGSFKLTQGTRPNVRKCR